ncbi:hypothetical protein ZOSMA_142G00190 [Zostera marina]|uniref:Uncharacterized protein n=1 Tax=Zostera marina TaxID=29655 RepID=A0A0K9PZV5_ZOSMR|nr:hypothetical protein ZOSMA_142G00190 [Zostera marina]
MDVLSVPSSTSDFNSPESITLFDHKIDAKSPAIGVLNSIVACDGSSMIPQKRKHFESNNVQGLLISFKFIFINIFDSLFNEYIRYFFL